MKTKFNNLIVLTILAICLSSCGSDEKEFVDYEVNFFRDSPFLIYSPPIWETITEQYLKRDGHHTGATFTAIASEVLHRDSWITKTIASEAVFDLVVNCEDNSTQTITCNDFFQVNELIEVNNPAQYQTSITEEVLVDGTGAWVDAVYSTRTYYKLQTNPQYTPADNQNIISNTVSLRLPADIDPATYIRDNFMENVQFNCIESVSFSVE